MMYVGHASGQQVALKHWYSQTYIFTPSFHCRRSSKYALIQVNYDILSEIHPLLFY